MYVSVHVCIYECVSQYMCVNVSVFVYMFVCVLHNL